MNNIKESNFSYIKNIFESISNEYDFMNDLMTFNNHSKWKKEIVEIAIDSSPKKILDIATGTGDIAIKLSKIKGSIIEAIDISDNMLKIAQNKIDKLSIDNINLKVMYTPGHTDCSYSYLMNDKVFTGDTLLINGTGRTDFQNGNARQQYDSIFNKLLKLPENTMVYPAHDYNGKKHSTIGSERKNNPRLQVNSVDQYVEIMNNLKLANPKMMDVAVPANLKGLTLNQVKA